MTFFPFAARGDVPIVRAEAWGRRGERSRPRLVLDTGCATTILKPDVVDDLGFSPRDGERTAVTRSAVGEETGYLLRLPRFRCIGQTVADLHVFISDLPGHLDIDGLLGWDFLRRFDVTIRPRQGRIALEPASEP